MNLLTKKVLLNLPLIFAVLLGSSFFFYYHLKNALDNNVKEALEVRKNHIVEQLSKSNNTFHPDNNVFWNNIYSVINIQRSQATTTEIVNDTLIYDEIHEKYLPYRQVQFSVCNSEECFEVFVREIIVDDLDILETVTLWILLESFIIAIIIAILNSVITRRVMKPMYVILEKLSKFDIESKKKFPSTNSSVREFKDLNASLTTFTQKIQEQYREMKEFTSHFTHELQTPLAIIKAQTDMLMQEPNLDENQLISLDTIKRTTQNISKFESALILIKEIEKGEYHDQHNIDIKECINQKLVEIEELLTLREIKLDARIKDKVEVMANPVLMDSLLNNIISNAVRHNIDHGTIEILLSNNGILSVKNTINTSEYNKKPKTKNKGLGMGLNIVKTICKRYGFEMKKMVVNHQHFLMIIKLRK